ncbi:MAG: MOSC domain-containing protein [Hyphococcus sp.]
MRVSSLHYYPIKGVRAVDCERADFDQRGLAHDRRWLITDENGQSLTQRDHAVLARIDATVTGDGLRLACGDNTIDIAYPDDERRGVFKVWRDDVAALDAGEDASAWLSDLTGRSARLCFMDEKALRMSTEKWTPQTAVNFADMHPFLITTTASLHALNEAIAANGGEALGMERFRPNIVIDGAEAWAEDGWKVLRIGGHVIDVIIPCDRCVVTTKDQKTGESVGKEPLKTLAKIRKSAHPDIGGVLFGWRAAPRGAGAFSVGDAVEVLEERPGGWPLQSA